MASDRGTRGAVALVVALAAGGGLGFGLYLLDGRGLLPVQLPFPVRAAPSASPSSDASPTASPSASASGPASAAPAGAPSSAPAEAPSPGACLRGLFPEDTFTAEPELPFVCDESSAADAVSQLKTKIVVEGRGRAATGGMKEWAVLGFYELAAVSALRGRCCPNAAPLTVPEAEPCKLGESMAAIGTAAHAGAPKADMDAAEKRFDGEVRCLMKLRQTQRFGYEPLLGGEASNFAKTAARLE